MHSADYAVVRCPSVYLSVRPFVAFMYCIETNKHMSSQFFSPFGSTPPFWFPYQTLWQYSDEDLRNGGVECWWGTKNALFDRYVALYRK